jgi:hypothetical protein
LEMYAAAGVLLAVLDALDDDDDDIVNVLLC